MFAINLANPEKEAVRHPTSHTFAFARTVLTATLLARLAAHETQRDVEEEAVREEERNHNGRVVPLVHLGHVETRENLESKTCRLAIGGVKSS